MIRCYFDYNASAPVLREVKDFIVNLLDHSGNPSSVHTSGRQAKNILETAREEVASIVNANKDSIIFTSGATEANNLALNSFDRIISSNIEHDSIRLNKKIDLVKVTKDGIYDVEALENKIKSLVTREKLKVLVSTMYANNETGIIQPVKKISQMTKKYNVAFHTDAVQAVGRIPVDMEDLDCDMMTLSSHKIGGPTGAGALVIKNKTFLKSMVVGGSQEKNLRAGTEPLLSLAGFGKAAKLCDPKLMMDVIKIRDNFEKILLESNHNIKIIGCDVERLPNTILFSIPGIKSENLLMALDMEGFEVSTGAACSSGQVGPSKTLMAMGLPDRIVSSCVRVSLGTYNTMDEILRFNKILNKIIENLSVLVK